MITLAYKFQMNENECIPINVNLRSRLIDIHDTIRSRLNDGKDNKLEFVAWRLKDLSIHATAQSLPQSDLCKIIEPLLPLYSGLSSAEDFQEALVDFMRELLSSDPPYRVRLHTLELMPGSPWAVIEPEDYSGDLCPLPVDIDSVPNWISLVKRHFSLQPVMSALEIIGILLQLVRSSKSAVEVVQFRRSFKHLTNAPLYNSKVVQWFLDDLLCDISQAVHYGGILEEWEMQRYAENVVRLSSSRGLNDYFATFVDFVKSKKCKFSTREWQGIKRVQAQIYGHMKQSFFLLREINVIESRTAGL